jgi:hypothetical protein
MKTFNEYAFLEDLQTTIKEENPTDVWELIHEEIERECIYYADCFEIVRALHITDWKDNEFGEITNITQLAFAALYEYVSENLEVEAE